MPASANASQHPKQFAERAVVESLIGMLDMDAETGNPAIFRVQHRTEDGELVTSPYALFAGQDEGSLFVSTGHPGDEPLSIPRGSIVHITLVSPSEIVRALNTPRPVIPLSRFWTAAMAYYGESYRQWESAFTAAQRVAGVSWQRPKKTTQDRQEETI